MSIGITITAADMAASETLRKVAESLDGVTEAVKDTNKEGTLGEQVFDKLFSSMTLANLAASAIQEGLNFITDTFKTQIKEAGEAEVMYARIDATLQSMGRTSEFTANQLSAMAEDFSFGTMFDDESILEAMNTLLRFDSVTANTLPKITQLSIDMAAAMGTNVASAANILGGALETGLLPEQLKVDKATRDNFRSMVELGHEAEALGLMMDVLGDKFEGTAQKMGDTATGAQQRVTIAWNNMQEAQGKAYATQTKDFNAWLAGFIEGSTQEYEIRQRAVEMLHEQGNAAAIYWPLLGKIVGATKEEADAALEAARAEREHRDAIAGVRKEGEDGVNIRIDFSVYGLDELSEAERKIKELKNQQDLNFIFDLQMKTEDFDADRERILEEMEETVAKIKELEEQMGKSSKKKEKEAIGEDIEELKDDVRDLTNELNQNEEEFKKWQKQVVFSLIQARLAADGLSDAEFDFLLGLGQEMGLLDPEVVEQAKEMLEAVSDVDPGNLEEAVRDVKYLIGQDGKHITIHVNQIITTTEGGSSSSSDSGTGGGTATETGGTGTTFNNYGTMTFPTGGDVSDFMSLLRG